MASMADSDPNLRPWKSSRDQAFSEALVDYLLHLDVHGYDERQRKMIWHNLRTQDRCGKWHYPALPYDVETEENTHRLLPTFNYSFQKRGDRWIFYKFRFSGNWKCDPDTGNIVVPTLEAWSNVLDNQNHYRQSRGWPLLQPPCCRFLYDSGVCTCDACPDASRCSGLPGSDDADLVQCIAGPLSPGASQPSQDGPSRTETNRGVRRVRFAVASEESSRVRFLVSSSGVSTSPTQPTPPNPRRSILKVKVPAVTCQSSERAETASHRRTESPRLTAPLLPPLTSRVNVYSTQFYQTQAPRSFNLASKAVRARKHSRSEMLSELEKAMAIPIPAPSNRSEAECYVSVSGTILYAPALGVDWDSASQSSTEWEIVRCAE